MKKIIIKNAYENNLKHISLEIPLDSFTCVTGCSGCGKSSLVFDTIYAESQRAFLEGLGNIYGQKLMNKPKVGTIENLRPALNISQNYYNVNPRSSVGTTTEISYYLRSLFAFINSNSISNVSEKLFSSNNPKSFCSCCAGLGTEIVVSESLLVPDHDITLRNGAILYYKGPHEGKEYKYLEAFCEYYGIDIDKKFSQLHDNDIQLLLYSNDKIRYKLVYKEGKRKKQHYVLLRGAIPSIMDKISSNTSLTHTATYAKYMEEIPCRECGGAKLRKEVLEYRIGGLNYSEVENMELTCLYSWIKEFGDERVSESKQNVVKQLVNSIINRLEFLLLLNVGYLSLNRSIPSLSSGERQRIRLANQLTCSLKGLLYIFDEPCKGLHHRDITNIIKVTRDLIHRENTIIAIEHNKQYISSADQIIELGPLGGPDGGYLLRQSPPQKKVRYNLTFKQNLERANFFQVNNINFRNIHGQNVSFPVGGVTCITGVSGSGKSTLALAIARCFSRNSENIYGVIQNRKSIRRVIPVSQSPIGKTSRSTIVSYLEIFDEIRTIFSKTNTAKQLNLDPSLFSMNVKGGRCETCQGTGYQKIELNYLPSSYITCPECDGKRFNEEILSVTYCGKNIHDILETPITDIINLFKDTKKIFSTLNCMINLGVGYLKLGQMSMNLSGGEAQRVKLAKALCSASCGKNLYILDEPTSGLNDVDIDKFEQVLLTLQKFGETIIVIEHNIEFIARMADHIIDLGMLSGKSGGKVIAQGEPKDVFSNVDSSLYLLDNEKY